MFDSFVPGNCGNPVSLQVIYMGLHQKYLKTGEIQNCT